MNSLKILDDSGKAALLDYDWPGNIRELRHVVGRAALIASSDFIGAGEIVLAPGAGQKTLHGQKAALDLESFEARHIQEVLLSVDGRRKEAAEILGIDPKTLYRKIKRHQLR